VAGRHHSVAATQAISDRQCERVNPLLQYGTMDRRSLWLRDDASAASPRARRSDSWLGRATVDCRVAALLAMTGGRYG
jgi:hypothetical protein